MKANQYLERVREHAITYLKMRYADQELEAYFTFETYLRANLRYVLRNIHAGFHNCTEQDCGVRHE